MRELLDALVDEGSFLEVHARWAKELIVGYARLDGRVVGIVANQPKFKGGVLFVDSADKAARFIWTCNAFGIPLLFLADVPGFMIGTAVERQGIIRHGAKMISAVSEATVPKLSVIVRKAYGAGLYAMAGPAFEPDACLALPTAKIAVMGPSAAVNAVFYNQLAAIEDEDERAAKRAELMEEYAEGVDLLHLASELVIDAVVQPEDLRDELIRRYAHAAGRRRPPAAKRHADPARLGSARWRDGKLLWEPPAERLRDSRDGALHGGRAALADYDALWRWSVDDLEGFWAAIWERFGVGGEHGAVLADASMPGARLVPGHASSTTPSGCSAASRTTAWRSSTRRSCAPLGRVDVGRAARRRRRRSARASPRAASGAATASRRTCRTSRRRSRRSWPRRRSARSGPRPRRSSARAA